MNISRRTFSATAAAAITSVASAQSNGKIRIGQVGTKHAHAIGKLAAIRKYPHLFEVVGVVEPDAGRQQSLMGHEVFQGLKWMTEEELLNTQGLQAVAVETAVEELVPTGLRCIQAGMHIHLDKPAGESMSECRQLHAEADQRNLTIQMGYMLRYNPAFEFLFHILEDNWLGEITEINGMMGKKMSDSGRLGLSRYEGGGMFELACHLIDAVVTVAGKPRSVTAFTHRTYPDKDTFADNQLAVMDYESAIAAIRCNHIDPLGSSRREFSVTGTEGTLEIRPLEPARARLGLDRDRGDYKKGFQDVELPNSAGRYDAEFLHLAAVVNEERELDWDSTHDLAVHETVLRACGMEVD